LHETHDLGGGAGGHDDRDFGLLKSAHFCHLVNADRKIRVKLVGYKTRYPLQGNLLGQGRGYRVEGREKG
jgi:hypothetical protein